MSKKIPFPILFSELMPVSILPMGVNDYDPLGQTVKGFEAMGPTMTSSETATGGHGDTDSDSDSD